MNTFPMYCLPIEPAFSHQLKRVHFTYCMDGSLDSPQIKCFLYLKTDDMRDYKTEMTHRFTEAWKAAQDQIHKAQKSQKENYDRNAAPSKVHIGDRVFIYTPLARHTSLLAHMWDHIECFSCTTMEPV